MRVGSVCRIAARVPPALAGPVIGLGALSGALAAPGAVRSWRRNLSALGLVPPPGRMAGARLFFHHLMLHYESLAWLGGRPLEVAVAGGERLLDALSLGRGAILLTVHTGNWHVAGSVVGGMAGRPVHSVAGVQLLPGWTADLRRAYRLRGVRIHSRGRGVRPLLAALRRGELVALHLDGDQHAGSGPAARGAALLARRAVAPVLPAVSRRIAPGRSRVQIGSPLPGRHLEDPARVVALLAEWVAPDAEQWTLLRPLWGRG